MRRSSGPGLLLTAALAALCGWHLLLRAHGRGLPLITDEGEYAAAARAWSEGGLPYRDAFSQKPPMIFLLYRAAAALSPRPESPRALAGAATLATLLLLFFCAPRSWSPPGRLAASATFAALSALPIGDYGFVAGTESLVNLCSALAACALLRGWPLAAGAAAGLALASKQTFLWTLLGFGAFAFWTGRGAAFAAGAALTFGAWAAYFALRGAFSDYWDAAWAGNLRYASVIMMTGTLASQLRWFATTLLPRLILFAAPALALGGLGLRGLQAGPGRPLETLAVLWLGSAVAGALTGLFLFPHYFLTLAPALSLAAACGVERLSGEKRRWVAALALAAWPALLAPRLIFLSDARQRGLALLYPNPLFESKILGEELRARAASDDRLHVFGSEGALFSYSRLRPATRHTLCYALTLFPRDAAAVAAELDALRRAPPRFVIWSTQPLSTLISSRLGLDYRDGLYRLLAARYHYAGRVRVTDAPAPPVFEPARQGERPGFEAADALLLFERAGP